MIFKINLDFKYFLIQEEQLKYTYVYYKYSDLTKDHVLEIMYILFLIFYCNYIYGNVSYIHF